MQQPKDIIVARAAANVNVVIEAPVNRDRNAHSNRTPTGQTIYNALERRNDGERNQVVQDAEIPIKTWENTCAALRMTLWCSPLIFGNVGVALRSMSDYHEEGRPILAT